jgi:flagellar hook-associated protein 1 FlgK
MSGLFGSLVASANSLRVFENSISTGQNNVNNAKTPGYAKQRSYPLPASFNPQEGLAGGIESGDVSSFRSRYAEQAVRQAQVLYSQHSQRASDLSRIEQYFDVSGESGVPKAISDLFLSISDWSLAPNDTSPRQQVLDRAGLLAARFNEAASNLGDSASTVTDEVRDAITQINNLSGTIRDINVQIQKDYAAQSDPSLDARLHSTLEELSQYADVTVLRQPNGSVSVLMGGETPLVMGERQYQIQGDFSGGTATVLDHNGDDVTYQARGGRLGALLEMKNTTIPSYLNQLNTLAAGIADTMNAALATGVDINGVAGAALFTYNSTDDAAATLQVTEITPAELAAASAAQPGGNQNALDLAAMANSPQVDGLSYMAHYARLAGGVGQDLLSASDDEQTHQQLLLQAQSVRDGISGVSLDEEAVQLIEFQRAYQASAQMISILNELTGVAIEMVR